MICMDRSAKIISNYELANDERTLNNQARNSIFGIVISFIILISSFVICSAAPLGAEEIPIDIKADKLKYVEGTDIIIASGSVEVTLKGVTIKSDLLTMDSKTNVATALLDRALDVSRRRALRRAVSGNITVATDAGRNSATLPNVATAAYSPAI